MRERRYYMSIDPTHGTSGSYYIPSSQNNIQDELDKLKKELKDLNSKLSSGNVDMDELKELQTEIENIKKDPNLKLTDPQKKELDLLDKGSKLVEHVQNELDELIYLSKQQPLDSDKISKISLELGFNNIQLDYIMIELG